MKNLLLLCVFTALFITPAKPRFKYLSSGVPVYMSINGLGSDADDPMLSNLKDTLHKIRFTVINKAQYDDIARQNRDALKSTLDQFNNNTISVATAKERFGSAASSAMPVQSITIHYSSLAGAVFSFETCDSVGFAYRRYPPSPGEPLITRLMWNISEIGSRTPDSIAHFLLKKM